MSLGVAKVDAFDGRVNILRALGKDVMGLVCKEVLHTMGDDSFWSNHGAANAAGGRGIGEDDDDALFALVSLVVDDITVGERITLEQCEVGFFAAFTFWIAPHWYFHHGRSGNAKVDVSDVGFRESVVFVSEQLHEDSAQVGNFGFLRDIVCLPYSQGGTDLA